MYEHLGNRQPHSRCLTAAGLEMDVRKLAFDDGSFDVAIDKGAH